MELGGDYSLSLSQLTVKDNNIFRYLDDCSNAIYFDSGRNALKHLIKKLERKTKVLLPEFICESVNNCFDRETIDFYKIKSDFTIDIDDLEQRINEDTDIIFLMHYFGAVQPAETLKRIKVAARDNNCIIIEDTTHSIFSEVSTIGDYQICSLRKWMPIPSGGVLYSVKKDMFDVFENLAYRKNIDNDRAYGMILKDLFLNYGLDCNPFYRKIFAECEERLDESCEINLMSDLTAFMASCVDTDTLRRTRISNYKRLEKTLAKIGIFPAIRLGCNECPLVLPIRVGDRNAFRSYLIENKAYCAVHWPFDELYPEQRPFARECADYFISLPIDQRYGNEEIDYLASLICDYMEKTRC